MKPQHASLLFTAVALALSACGGATAELDTATADDGSQDEQAFHIRHDHHHRVAGDGYRTCFIDDTGDVHCMGLGPLGDGTSNSSTTPVLVSGLHNVVDIAMGGVRETIIALRADGTMWQWGGLDGFLAPDFVNLSPIAMVQVSAANCDTSLQNGCAIGVDGKVYAVGVHFAAPVSGVANATALSRNGTSTCALISNGTVKCWGANGFHELGNGTSGPNWTPTTVAGLTDAIALDGDYSECVIIAGGTMKCWGRNLYGQVGNGTKGSDVQTPQLVSSLGGEAVEVGVGPQNACASLADGTARCWGNGNGTIGNGSNASSSVPVPVSNLSHTSAIEVGGYHACAIDYGYLSCWGGDYYGELGNGQSGGTLTFNTPQQLPGNASTFSRPSVAVGQSHACWVRADGAVKCWGDNSRGQLGNASFVSSLSPTFTTISTVSDISAGLNTTCAVKTNGTVQCWGCPLTATTQTCTQANAQWSPTQVAGISDAVTVRVAGSYACALLASGNVVCWGADGAADGVIGNGTFAGSATPASTGITNAVALDANIDHACAILDSGLMKCWGSNLSGQLGTNNNTNAASPVTVQSFGPFASVATGYQFTQATTVDGHAFRWGTGSHGNGNGGSSGSLLPVQIANETDIVDVGAGVQTSCLVNTLGHVRCYGYDADGERGDGTGNNADSSTPGDVQVAGVWGILSPLANVVSVHMGLASSCAVTAANKVYCWGEGSSGQNGNGTTNDQFTARFVSGLTF